MRGPDKHGAKGACGANAFARFLAWAPGCWLAAALCTAGAERAADRPVPRFAKHIVDSNLPAISATATDVDGDGVLDIVAAGGASGGLSPHSMLVYWYHGNDWIRKPVCRLGDKSIILHLEAVSFSLNSRTVDRSRKPGGEVVITDGELGNIWWYRYDRSKGEWAGQIVVNDVRYAHGTANGDVDRDGWADVLVPAQHGTPKQGILWAKNPGDPAKPWTRHPLAENFGIGGWQHYVRLIDVNGDGRLDALHGSDAEQNGWFGYWLQKEDPTQPWEFHPLSCPGKHGTNLDGADLNGDGQVDFVGSEGHGAGLWSFLAPDYKPARVDDTLKSTHFVALADFNGDRAADIATCGYGSRTVSCFLNDGKGKFRPLVIDTNQCAYDGSAVDLDRDGDMDLLLAGQNSTNVVWYENLGVGRQPVVP